MSYDYAASMQGIRSAWRALEQTAHRIAAGSVGARKTPLPGAGVDPITGKKPADSDSSVMKLDIAQAMLDLHLAKIGVQVNTRVMAVEQELDRDTLDILA
jgi:hypothetical protein